MFDAWDDDLVRQVDESVELAKASHQTPPENKIPLNPSFFLHAFSSSPVEKAVHQYVVNNIPPAYPARSPKIVKIGSKSWVDHRTFGLSMQVYGSVSEHVINLMGTAVMQSQYNKHCRGELSPSDWGRLVVHHDIACRLQDTELLPNDVAQHFTEKNIGFRLDFADLVFIPIRKSSFWYVVVANFKDSRFEVICPFKDTALVEGDALQLIENFRKVFKAVHSRSTRVDIYDLPTVIGSVSACMNQNNSGVFVLQLLQSYNGRTHINFKEQHAEAIRESLTYYMCTHEDNQTITPEIWKIAERHGIKLENNTDGTRRSRRK